MEELEEHYMNDTAVSKDLVTYRRIAKEKIREGVKGGELSITVTTV